MKVKFIIIPIILLFTTAFAHAQWEVQLDLQNFAPLYRVFFLDENYGWAIGGGPYFYTTDGGQNWYLSDDWWDIQGEDIVFVNTDTGFIASSFGIIYKTINGGQTWTGIQTPATQGVMRLFFVDENNGWATLNNFTDSSQIIHTTSGGNTWYPQQIFEINTSSVLPIYFLNDSVGYGGGGYYDIENDDSYCSIVKTKDKGETWEIIYLSQNTFYSICDIYFRDTVIGWAVGQKNSSNAYLIINTENGGETWEEKTIPELTTWYGTTVEASSIYSIQFVNDTLGWLTCQDEYGTGYILLTTNGGEMWQQQFVNYNFFEPIYDICMVDNSNGWAVGGDYMYHTSNGDTIIVVGIGENLQVHDLVKIEPNPFSESIQLHIPDEFYVLEMFITDIAGKICFLKYSDIKNQLDLSFLKQGIYFLTLKYNTKNQFHSFTKKIIKL